MRFIGKIVLLVCFSYCIKANGQTFIKRFTIDSIATIANSMELRDSFIFIVGLRADTVVNFGIRSFAAKMDYEGNLLSYFSFRPTQYSHFVLNRQNSLISTSDGGFACTGYAMDSADIIFLTFFKFDSLGQMEYYKVIAANVPGNQAVFSYNLLQTLDGNYFITGSIQLVNFDIKTFAAKLDTGGNLQWFKYYNTIPLQNSSRGISRLSDSILLVSIGATDLNSQEWKGNYKTCLLMIDTLGNQRGLYVTPDSNTIVSVNVRTTYDGKYLSCGEYFENRQISNYGYKDYLIKWDTNYNQLWNLKAGVMSPWSTFLDFEQTPSNHIVLSGMQCCDTLDGGRRNATLTKVSKDGTLEWMKTYRGITSTNMSGEYNILTDVDLMPNGDIVAVGECDGDTPDDNIGQYGWIIRVHEDGCMDDGFCGYTDIEEPKTKNEKPVEPVRFSPNPSQGIFSVYVQEELPPATTIQVYDLRGTLLTRQPLFGQANLLNLYSLPNGIYFYQIGNGLVKVQSGKLVIQK